MALWGLRYVQRCDTPNQICAADTTDSQGVSNQLDSADWNQPHGRQQIIGSKNCHLRFELFEIK